MSKEQHADSTPDEKAPNSTTLSADEVLVEAARNGDTTAVRAGLEKLSPDTDSKTVAFDAVHEACRGNHDECLALLLPYVETTQMGFGMLLSECIHADHTACTEVLLQHWKSVCSNVAFVPHGQEDRENRPCPAMWEDPAVCQVLSDAGADIETKDDMGRSPLHMSCCSGALAVAKILVAAAAGVCVTDSYGLTPLLVAAFHEHTETVRYLVGLKDVDVNHSGDKGKGHTALFLACQKNYPEVAQVLIAAGADIQTRNENGRSPLHKASMSGALDVVKVLVQAGAGAGNVTDNRGVTCLVLASYMGHTETVRYLVGLKEVDLKHADSTGCTALGHAVVRNHPDVVEVLIDAGADIDVKDTRGRSPLHKASISGSLDVLKMLVKAGADVRVTDNKGYTCLTLAVANGRTETVRYLAGLKDVDVNHSGDKGHTALHLAGGEDYAEVAQLLIDAGADIETRNEKGRSPLQWACGAGSPYVVKALVKAGAGVYVRDYSGGTCLILAACCGHTETVRTLLCMPEVDLEHADSTGCTALNRAVVRQYPDVIQVLIDAGADIEAKDEKGRSPLLNASIKVRFSGNLDIVKMLVRAGAGVCVANNDGDTCLVLASSVGNTETVRYLASLPEVDVNHANQRGMTSLYRANQFRHPDVAKFLRELGADPSL